MYFVFFSVSFGGFLQFLQKGHVISRTTGIATQGCCGKNTARLENTSLQQKDQGHHTTLLEASLPFKMSGCSEATLNAGFEVTAFHVHLPIGKERCWERCSLEVKISARLPYTVSLYVSPSLMRWFIDLQCTVYNITLFDHIAGWY